MVRKIRARDDHLPQIVKVGNFLIQIYCGPTTATAFRVRNFLNEGWINMAICLK